MTIDFPYEDTPPLDIPADLAVDTFDLPRAPAPVNGRDLVAAALRDPIGSRSLRELAPGTRKVLVAVDDVSRPTPVAEFIELVLAEVHAAGVPDDRITIITSLGTHRPMTGKEIERKLGSEVAGRYTVLNHDWADPSLLEYLGETEQGSPVWVNRAVREHDLVIGIGAIMPIDICGFTGGGKIIVPGLSGPETVDSMHWTRIDVPSDEIIGHAENPVRASIDALARKAGLDFIVNVVMDGDGRIVEAVAGDLVSAHREGARRAAARFRVAFEQKYDIVVADAFPFDIEFWQANKALDTAGHFVRDDGTIILVTPCYEGWSQTHRDEIVRHGYGSTDDVRLLVEEGRLSHIVVGVHMYQVAEAAVDKAGLIFVSSGLPADEVARVGFTSAPTVQAAFELAMQQVVTAGGRQPRVAVLRNAARMIPAYGGNDGSA